MSNAGPSEYSVIVVEDDQNEVFLLKRAFQEAHLQNPVLLFREGQEVIDYLSRLGTDDGTGWSKSSSCLTAIGCGRTEQPHLNRTRDIQQ